MAGAIAELTRWSLRRDFRNIDPRTATTILVKAGERILAPFPEDLAAYARRELEKVGMLIQTRRPVENIGPGEVTIGGETIRVRTVVWQLEFTPPQPPNGSDWTQTGWGGFLWSPTYP